MKKIRILQFPVANSKGGITQYVLQNWKFIDKSKFQFDFATMSKSLDFASDLEREGCKVHYISCYAEQDKERFTAEFRKILTEGDYDVVHLHTKQWKSFLVEQIAKEVGVKKIIIHAHSTGVDTLDEKRREEEIELHNRVRSELTEDIATDFWACSWKAADFIFGDKISKDKIKIMNNAIDLSKYRYDPNVRNRCRRKLGIADDEYVIGNIGRFVYQKNQEFLLKVFSEICKKDNDSYYKFRLLLVGSGEKEKEYREIVCRYGVKERVIFTGFRKDVAELLQVMDIFCLPSRFEGLGIVLIEAQTAGLTCIGSEFVPEEALLTERIVRLPYDVSLWKKRIIEEYDIQHIQLIKRSENINIERLKGKGYEIKEQIKYIEKQYLF